MENTLNVLSSRAGFNTALRHFKSVTAYASEVSAGANLARLINESLDAKEIERFQVKTILNALLIDKFRYAFNSHNFERTIENVDGLVKSISQWGNINLILSYFHPQAGHCVADPKIAASWVSMLPIPKDEFVVIYAGPADSELEPKVYETALDDFLALLYGAKIKAKQAYLGRGRVEVEEEAAEEAKPQRVKARAAAGAAAGAIALAPAPAAGASVLRMTPRYSIQVTNELFHNGNVEAWKRIVESFKNKYSGLDVLIWYENERINDINSLFKWGKVKHGGLIFFSVAGENIQGVSKLQRYLFEGASPRFEAFLRGAVGRTLDLF
jgi:hypothetical protein